MSLKKRIIMNAGSNWANMLVTAAIGLVLVPIILSSVGVLGFGVWALLAYGLNYPMILNSAFTLAINRFVAYYHNDIKELNRFVSASFLILTGLAILTMVVVVLLSFVVSDIFAAIPAEMAGDAQVTCILVGLTFALRMLESSFIGALQGYQYYTRSNTVTIASNLLRVILVVVLLIVWKSIIAVQLAYVIARAISTLSMFFVARWSIVGLRIDVRQVTKGTMRELFKYTAHSVARSGSIILMYTTMTLLVGWVGRAADVTVYTIAFQLAGFVRSLLGGAQNVFLPVITSLHVDGQVDKIKALVKKGTQISAVLIFASSILLFVFAEEILTLWLRRPVSQEMVLVVRVLIISIIPRGIFGIWLPALVGMGYLRWLTIMAISIASSAILLELILLQGFVITPMAPAIAMGVVLWVCRGVWLPFYGLRKLGMSAYEYLKDSLCQPIMASMVSITALRVLSGVLPKESIHWLVMFIVSTAVVMASFVAISLRGELADLVATARKRFGGGKERYI